VWGGPERRCGVKRWQIVELIQLLLIAAAVIALVLVWPR
jgi:hypothetical protein